MSAPTYDRAQFAGLQATLADSWPQMTMRTTTGGPRTLVVLSSMSVEIPDYFDPLLTAYEERYLLPGAQSLPGQATPEWST